MIHKGEAACFGLREMRIYGFDGADDFVDNLTSARASKRKRALTEDAGRNGSATVSDTVDDSAYAPAAETAGRADSDCKEAAA
jgi:hypothetical protein